MQSGTQEQHIIVPVRVPTYSLGQTIYVPRQNSVTKTQIIAYDVTVMRAERALLGVVTSYQIDNLVSLMLDNLCSDVLTSRVRDCDVYADELDAINASRFVDVTIDDETWDLALGSDGMTDESTPYHRHNSGLPPCCNNIELARSVLTYCRNNRGLIVHERNQLLELMVGHDNDYKTRQTPQSPIRRIFEQLKL